MSLDSVKERASASAWTKIRSLLRNTVVECSAMPTDQSCIFYPEAALYRCLQCAYYCHDCFGQAHRITNIFHTGEVWQIGVGRLCRHNFRNNWTARASSIKIINYNNWEIYGHKRTTRARDVHVWSSMQWRSRWLVAARILPVLQQATVLALVPVYTLSDDHDYDTESEEEKDQESSSKSTRSAKVCVWGGHI